MGQYFNGIIDEVRIYNRALSASEVAARYQAQPEDTDTLHYYLGGKEVAFKTGGTLYFPLQDHLGSSAVMCTTLAQTSREDWPAFWTTKDQKACSIIWSDRS